MSHLDRQSIRRLLSGAVLIAMLSLMCALGVLTAVHQPHASPGATAVVPGTAYDYPYVGQSA